jgi:tetratricopeptide (TPR) repeat protein
MSLCLRKEESFGPLAFEFGRTYDLDKLGLLPEEQFNLWMALSDAYADEPKRFKLKLEALQKALDVLHRSQYADQDLLRHIRQEMQKTEAELAIYNEAYRTPRPSGPEKYRIIVETDLPDYFLSTAQKRATAYYQKKFKLTPEAHAAQQFKNPGAERRFQPDNQVVHKEFPGACGPFMNARTNAFHLMLPFDLKLSRKPDDPLDAGVRIWYGKMGYSYPLRFEMGKLCSYFGNEVLDVPLDDPNLLFVSVSEVKETELGSVGRALPQDVPPEIGLPRAFLEGSNSLGPFLQIVCNIKVWFDASNIALLLQGAPDLYEYGLFGASGLVLRTYGTEKVQAYAQATQQPWMEGLSFNFINIHLGLPPNTDTGFVPANTPLFTVYPVLNRQTYTFKDVRSL